MHRFKVYRLGVLDQPSTRLVTHRRTEKTVNKKTLASRNRSLGEAAKPMYYLIESGSIFFPPPFFGPFFPPFLAIDRGPSPESGSHKGAGSPISHPPFHGSEMVGAGSLPKSGSLLPEGFPNAPPPKLNGAGSVTSASIQSLGASEIGGGNSKLTGV